MIYIRIPMKWKAYIAIIIAEIELSFLPILTSTGNALGTLQFLFFVFLTSSIVSFVIVVYMKKAKELIAITKSRKAMGVVFSAGILNYALPQLLLTLGIAGTNPVIGSLVIKLWPILLAIMQPFFLKTKVKPQQIIALFLGFASVYVLIAGNNANMGKYEMPYIIILIGYALSIAFSNIIIKGNNYDIYSQVFLFNIFSLISVSAVMLVLHLPFIVSINITEFISFLFLGAITYSIGALLYFYTLKTLNPLIASNATYATPALTALFSNLLLGTKLYAYYGISFVLLIGALIIMQLYSSKAPEYSNSKRFSFQLFDVTGVFMNTKNSVIKSALWEGNKALAIKLKKEQMQKLSSYFNNSIKNYNCIIQKVDSQNLSLEEQEFINDIMNKKENEDIIIGVGDPKDVESAFNEITEMLCAL